MTYAYAPKQHTLCHIAGLLLIVQNPLLLFDSTWEMPASSRGHAEARSTGGVYPFGVDPVATIAPGDALCMRMLTAVLAGLVPHQKRIVVFQFPKNEDVGDYWGHPGVLMAWSCAAR